jgi:hypothetical protein
MDGDFTFTRDSMRPDIQYDATGSSGRLRIEEPSGPHIGNAKYRWDMRLNDSRPIELDVTVGAGECQLDLGTLNLRGVTMRMGAGELKLDLRGIRKRLRSHPEGGVGEATVYLPQGVGVTADVRGGIGDIDVQGLEKRDGRYVNCHGQSRRRSASTFGAAWDDQIDRVEALQALVPPQQQRFDGRPRPNRPVEPGPGC